MNTSNEIKSGHCGSKLRPTFVRKIDPVSGDKSLSEGLPENVYQLVQEAARGVKLSELVDRSLRGDPTAIPPSRPSLTEDLDLTELPKSSGEALQAIANAKSLFEQLPSDVKSQYGNNSRLFFNALQDGTFKAAQDAAAAEAKHIDELKAAELKRKEAEIPAWMLNPDNKNKLKEILNG